MEKNWGDTPSATLTLYYGGIYRTRNSFFFNYVVRTIYYLVFTTYVFISSARHYFYIHINLLGVSYSCHYFDAYRYS